MKNINNRIKLLKIIQDNINNIKYKAGYEKRAIEYIDNVCDIYLEECLISQLESEKLKAAVRLKLQSKLGA